MIIYNCPQTARTFSLRACIRVYHLQEDTHGD